MNSFHIGIFRDFVIGVRERALLNAEEDLILDFLLKSCVGSEVWVRICFRGSSDEVDGGVTVVFA